MSSHDYTGCQDLACDLFAAALICPCLFCKHTRRVLVLHLTPTINPSAWTPKCKLAGKAARCAIVVLASICGASKAKLDTGELSE